MKKFLIKVSIFILIILTITCLINFKYIKLNKTDVYDTKKFDNIPLLISICNFGSSHGQCGFNYEDVINQKCFNFALSGQFLSYDRRIFDYYKDHIRDGAVIFIPVSYHSLFGNDERTEPDFIDKNKCYYNILPSYMIKNYDLKTNIYMKYFPSLCDKRGLLNVLMGKTKSKLSEIWQKTAENIDVKKDAEYKYNHHLIFNKLDENGNRIINYEEIDALKYMIKACKSIKASPILITTPFLHEYTDIINKNDSNFYKDFYGLIDKIVNETDVIYYDYSHDERFNNSYNLFMDSDHLNKEGARQFTNIIMNEVLDY